jgi:D-alanine--poly(phosphoribitol) ligase subunit 1
MFTGSFGAALRDAAVRNADRRALWAVGTYFTYRELFDEAARIAVGLKAAGAGPDTRVAILSHRTITAYASVLGCLLTGCPFVPLNTAFPQERNANILGATRPEILIADAKSAAKLEAMVGELSSDCILVLPEAGSALPEGFRTVTADQMPATDFTTLPEPPVGADDLAYIMFTSGTTGMPKGVQITHRNVAAYLGGVSEVVPHTADDRILQISELTFDVCIHDMGLGWLNGGEVYSLPENTVLLAPRLMLKYGITSCMMAPSAAAHFLRMGANLPALRLSLFCGEGLPAARAKAWLEAAPNSQLFNIYGPTECTVLISAHRFDPVEDAALDIVPIGLPFSTQGMAVFDAENRRLPDGDVGEILLSGTQLSPGYLNAPEVNAAKFVEIEGERWYRTGDLGKYVEGQGFLYLGRLDRQVKIHSYRVGLQEIEGAVRRVTGRDEIAIVPWPKLSEGSYGGSAAFICGPELETAALRKACGALIPSYMVPDRYVFVDELPLNSNGKVDHKVLHARLEEEDAATAAQA